MKGAWTISIAAAATAFAFTGKPGWASACNHEIVAPIRMSEGQACWSYRGTATTFVGEFEHGQRISAEMSGEGTDYDPRTGRTATAWRSRDPNVEGPGGFYFGDADAPGALTFIAPANGTYRFRFSPCAMWGAPGIVRICAK
jgi:hypothetical protein